jgi:hypothetical protein
MCQALSQLHLINLFILKITPMMWVLLLLPILQMRKLRHEVGLNCPRSQQQWQHRESNSSSLTLNHRLYLALSGPSRRSQPPTVLEFMPSKPASFKPSFYTRFKDGFLILPHFHRRKSRKRKEPSLSPWMEN